MATGSPGVASVALHWQLADSSKRVEFCARSQLVVVATLGEQRQQQRQQAHNCNSATTSVCRCRWRTDTTASGARSVQLSVGKRETLVTACTFGHRPQRRQRRRRLRQRRNRQRKREDRSSNNNEIHDESKGNASGNSN